MPRPSPSSPPVQHHVNEFIDGEAALAFEDDVWWYAGRRAIVERFLQRARRVRPLGRIVDVGCGSGPHLGQLAAYGEVTAIDPSPTLAARCQARGIPARIVIGDLDALGAGESFDLVCLFDVLEHIEDDRAFLRSLERCLPTGGLLLLSVPAGPWLYGPHDVRLHHFRRYSKRGLERVLDDSGYRVLFGSHYLSGLFPLAAAARLFERLRARAGLAAQAPNLGRVPPRLNRLLTRVLAMEAALAERRPLPFGLWLVYLAQRATPG